MNLQVVSLFAITEAPGFNPRTDYGKGDGSLQELADSIREVGLLQAPTIRATDAAGQSWHIVAGHRRIAALRLLAREEAECFCLPCEDDSQGDLLRALIENCQRKSLSPLERAQGFQRLLDMGLTHRDAAGRLGVSQAHFSKSVELLTLPAKTQKAISERAIGVEAGYTLTRLARAGVPAARINHVAAKAKAERLTAYEVSHEVNEELGIGIRPGDFVPKNPEIILTVPASSRSDVDWTLRRFGSLAKALEELRRMSGGGAATPATTPISGPSVAGSYRDPMGLVRTAHRKGWEETLIGFNNATGAMIALPQGPLPSGYSLCCTLMPTGAVYVASTATGRNRTLAEQIKDAISGRRLVGVA